MVHLHLVTVGVAAYYSRYSPQDFGDTPGLSCFNYLAVDHRYTFGSGVALLFELCGCKYLRHRSIAVEEPVSLPAQQHQRHR